MMRNLTVLVLVVLLVSGCCGKPKVCHKSEKGKPFDPSARYQLYPVPERSIPGASAGVSEAVTNLFLLDRQTGRVWLYNDRFASFIKVRFLEAVALPVEQEVKDETDKFAAAFKPE